MEYLNLFKSQSLRQIILKLNDGMNSGKEIDMQLFKAIENQHNLQLRKIQNIVRGINNSSFNSTELNTTDISKGLYAYGIIEIS